MRPRSTTLLLFCLISATEIVHSELECFSCSWFDADADDASYLEKKRQEKEQMIDKLKIVEMPIDWPIQAPVFTGGQKPFGKDAVEKSRCTLKQPCNYCVRWTYLDNEVPINVTYLCVRSSKDQTVGHFRQKLQGLTKDVYICNDENRCNDAVSFHFFARVFSVFLTAFSITYAFL